MDLLALETLENAAKTAKGTSRSSVFAPKIVARARGRGAAAAPDDAPPESAAPAAEEPPRARAGRAPNLPQRKPREGKEKTPAAALAPDPAAGTRAPQSAAEAASGASRLRGVPAAAPDARTKAARDKEARHLEARAAMPPPPSVPARAAAAAAAAPPAHRWVRSASTTRGNRVRPGSQRASAGAGALAAVDDSLAKSIRDIIRQKSREERAAENRAKLAKRRSSEDPARPSNVGPEADGGAPLGTGGEKTSGSGHARDGDDSRALAVVVSPGGGGGENDAETPGVSATLALPAPTARAGPRAAVSMTPQVLVVDGQIVINEKSLTVNAAVERATALSDFTRVEESGTKLNSATYANYTKAEKWTKEDTEFFFQALRQFGTDFSLIQRLFPGRSRRQIKKKYLVEDKTNPARVEAAIRNLSPDVALYKNLIDVLKAPEGAAAGGAGECVAKTVLTLPADARNPDPALPAPPEASAASAAKGEPAPEAREEATRGREDPEAKTGKRRRVAPAAPARASSRRR